MKGLLKTYENNSMSLSCSGEIIINNDVIIELSRKGMKRTGGRDAWFAFYERKQVGDSITKDEIENILSFDGRNNVVSVFKEETK